MFHIQEIQRQSEGISFEEQFDLLQSLQERNPEILDLKDLVAQGTVSFDKGLYFLDYQLSYTITLASSRSLEPVCLEENYPVTEVFGEDSEGSLLSEDEAMFLLPLDAEGIDLEASVADHILLRIPLQVLTPEEEGQDQLPAGEDWQVLSEEDYARQQEATRKENNPFASLQDFFTE